MQEFCYGDQFVQRLSIEYKNAKNAYDTALENAKKVGSGVVQQVYAYMLPVKRYMESIGADFNMSWDEKSSSMNFIINIFNGSAKCDILINQRTGSHVIRWELNGNELIHTCGDIRRNDEIIEHQELEDKIVYRDGYQGVLDKIQTKIQKIIVHAAATGIL